nr:hypothetical protein Iba_chr10bCG5350 [Ipomoea batatas]
MIDAPIIDRAVPTDFACHVLLFTSNFSILNSWKIPENHGKNKCKTRHQVTNACTQSRRAIAEPLETQTQHHTCPAIS